MKTDEVADEDFGSEAIKTNEVSLDKQCIYRPTQII